MNILGQIAGRVVIVVAATVLTIVILDKIYPRYNKM